MALSVVNDILICRSPHPMTYFLCLHGLQIRGRNRIFFSSLYSVLRVANPDTKMVRKLRGRGGDTLFAKLGNPRTGLHIPQVSCMGHHPLGWWFSILAAH